MSQIPLFVCVEVSRCVVSPGVVEVVYAVYDPDGVFIGYLVEKLEATDAAR